MMVRGAMSWKSVKQSFTIIMEVEYVTCYEANHKVVWLRKFIVGFNIIERILISLTIYYNNNTFMNSFLNNKSSIHIKHFDMKISVYEREDMQVCYLY